MNHRAKMKIKGLKRMRKMRLNAMVVIKMMGKIKVCRSLNLKSRLFVFSGNVMDGKQRRNGAIMPFYTFLLSSNL